jgi:NAD(P)H-quinone oxidoreductase subunit 5
MTPEMSHEWILAALAAPSAVFSLLGLSMLLTRPLPQVWTGRLASGAFLLTLVSLGMAALSGNPAGGQIFDLGEWFHLGHKHFPLRLCLDWLSLTMAIVTAFTATAISFFSSRYLTRDPGYQRFYLLFLLFILGMLLVVLGSNVDLVFVGWEFLGISSALLVAFYQERREPVRNGLRVFIIYRLGDVAMLSCALLVHAWYGAGSRDWLTGQGSPLSLSGGPSWGPHLLAGLLILAAAVKSAQFPFCSWLPRAMEGPTPSSAVFYGALSVHAGAYLLLRALPVLEASGPALAALGAMGLFSALFATIAGRAQTDIKSTLAFASITQLGLIMIEISLGLPRLAVVHMTCHTLARLLQFLRAPSLFHDIHLETDALGGHRGPTGRHLKALFPEKVQRILYRFALERGYLDPLMDHWVAEPVLRLAARLDGWEKAWTDFLGGKRPGGNHHD